MGWGYNTERFRRSIKTMSEDKTEKKQLPLKPGMFKLADKEGERSYLIASKCKECGTYAFPRRAVCLNCGAESMEESPLSGRGRVYTYTIARQQLPGAFVQVPYAIAIILLEEGCQLHTVVTEDWENIKVDMDMEVYFEKVAEDPEGNDLFAYKFRAV
jgi:uncharacterized OB-fold protein